MEDPAKWVYEPARNGGNFDIEKHKRERAERGFSTYDWWNFNSHLCYVIIGGLERFKAGSGHPVYGDVKTMEDWVKTLDLMIKGFEARYALDNHDDSGCPLGLTVEEWRGRLEASWLKGAELFIEFFPSLWD